MDGGRRPARGERTWQVADPPAVDPGPVGEPLLEDEQLVEDVCIDGMCGVY
jgi:mycofactocin precursor